LADKKVSHLSARRSSAKSTRPYKPKSSGEISRNMAAIRSTENRTEVALRSTLHKLGLRFRKYGSDLPGKPDIVFTSSRVAVFVDGDYWHARILRERGIEELTNSIRTPTRDYWLTKFAQRVKRDDCVNANLRAQGWLVLRFWESEVKANLEETAISIMYEVRKRSTPAARTRRHAR
jgi:DNA mismatch endonuclease (patch repair protein)